MCERTRILGVDRDGGFADYVAVPASVVWRNDRAKLLPEIACLQEPFGNAVFATSTQEPGRAVAVLGCGPVGLFSIAIARAFGADGRPPGHRPLPARVREDAGRGRGRERHRGRGRPRLVRRGERDRAGVVFEMSGALKAIEDAFRIVRHGGNVVPSILRARRRSTSRSR